jgi:hypothetical protein
MVFIKHSLHIPKKKEQNELFVRSFILQLKHEKLSLSCVGIIEVP